MVKSVKRKKENVSPPSAAKRNVQSRPVLGLKEQRAGPGVANSQQKSTTAATHGKVAVAAAAQVLFREEQSQKIKEREEQQQKIKENAAAELRKRSLTVSRGTVVADFPRPRKLLRLDEPFSAAACHVGDMLLLDLTSSNASSEVIGQKVLPVSAVVTGCGICPYGLDMVMERSNLVTGDEVPADSLGSTSVAALNVVTEMPEPAAGVCVASKPFSHDETLLIFDWDNTILPSTWLFAANHDQEFKLGDQIFWVHTNDQVPEGAVGSVVGFNQERAPTTVLVKFPKGTWLFDPLDLLQGKELLSIANAAIEILTSAERCGTVVLVTNSDKGWIERTCSKFLPALYPKIENMRRVSAKTSFESETDSAIEWKLRTFKSEIERTFGKDVAADLTQRKNIISVGDGPEEREALLRGTALLRNCRAKSLKLVERPDITPICNEQSLIIECLDGVVHHDGNLDLVVTSKSWYDLL